MSKPVSTGVFAFCSEGIIDFLDSHDFTKDITTRGGDIFVFYHPSPDGKPLSTKFRYYTFNGVFLAALILAVPKTDFKTRLKILIIGFALICPFQLLLFIVYVFNHYARKMMIRDGFLYPDYLRWILSYGQKILLRVEGQLVPVVIWASLFYYYKWHNILTSRIKARSAIK